MDCTYTAQEAKELPYPAWTGREVLSSTAASMKFRDNDALLLIPWLEEISSNGPRMNFHLVLYNGRNISERIKKKNQKEREGKAGWGLLCHTATAGQEPARRAGEQERGESHGIHTPPVPPPGLNHGLQRWGKTGQFVLVPCTKTEAQHIWHKMDNVSGKTPLLWKSTLACWRLLRAAWQQHILPSISIMQILNWKKHLMLLRFRE